jgi:O-antigen/teichoic acid export membrane protein
MDEPPRQPGQRTVIRRALALGSVAWSVVLHKRKFLGSSAARASSVVVQTLLAFAISHLFGLGTLGDYYLITTWATLFGTVLSFGTSEYVMREIAQLEAAGSPNAAKATLLHGVGVASIPFIAVIAVLSLNPELSARMLLGSIDKSTFVLFLGPIAFIFALRRIVAHVLKGRSKPELGFLIEYSLPTFIVLVAIVGDRVFVGATIVSERVYGIALTAELASLMIGIGLVLTRWHGTDAFKSHYNFVFSLRLGLAVAMQAVFLNVVSLILPRYVGSEDIGTFGLCVRIAGVAMIFLEAVIGIYAPGFSVLMQQKKMRELRAHYNRARSNLWISSIPILLGVMLFAKPILALFDADRADAWLILVMLTLARFSEAILGPVSFFMWMIHRESVEAAATFLGVMITLSSVLFIGSNDALKTVTFCYMIAYYCRVCIDWTYISRNIFTQTFAQAADR